MKHTIRRTALLAAVLLSVALWSGCAAKPAAPSLSAASSLPSEAPLATDAPMRAIDTGEDTEAYTEPGFTLTDDQSEVLGICVTLPKLTEAVPQAAELNAVIEADFASLISLTPAQYGDLGKGFTNPVYEVDYRATEFDGVLQLCVFTRAYSSLGSGVIGSLHRYAIDLESGALLPDEAFATRMGLAADELADGFCTAFGINAEDARRLGYTTEKILADCFYIEPSGEVTFFSNLYA